MASEAVCTTDPEAESKAVALISRRGFMRGTVGASVTTPLLPTRVSAAERRPRLTEAQFQALAQRVSNWKRWGADDELGALNFITPAVTRTAGGLIREGRIVHCGAGIPSSMPDTQDHSGSITMRLESANSWGAINETITLDVHGHSGLTHLDALGHIYYRGYHFNGKPFSGVLGNRLATHGIETASAGIAGRGVFIDLAAARGQRWLQPQDRLTPEELTQAITRSGATLQPGDTLFLNTGVAEFQKTRRLAPGVPIQTGGMQVECAEIIHRSGVAIIVSDGGTDSFPSEVESVLIPWHILCLVQMGVRLVDGAQLAELAATCKELRRTAFFCTIAPIDYRGGTSSPVNPICIF